MDSRFLAAGSGSNGWDRALGLVFLEPWIGCSAPGPTQTTKHIRRQHPKDKAEGKQSMIDIDSDIDCL